MSVPRVLILQQAFRILGRGGRRVGYFFPGELVSLRAQADEAAMSRLYGGIHYRFDSDVGLRMGRAIAALGVARERSRGTVVFRNRVVAGFRN